MKIVVSRSRLFRGCLSSLSRGMYSTYFPDPRNHSKIFVLNVELLFDRVRMSWFSNILPDFVDYHTYSSVFHTKDEECFSTSERPGR